MNIENERIKNIIERKKWKELRKRQKKTRKGFDGLKFTHQQSLEQTFFTRGPFVASDKLLNLLNFASLVRF